jgi:endoglucanase
MTPQKEFLKKLISLSGISGYEDPVREAIADAWQPLVDELHTNPIGSLHGLKKGRGEEPRRRILLMAHMDAIGMMVTRTVGGFIQINEARPIDPRVLPGQPVIIHGRREIPGVIVQPPASLLPPSHGKEELVGMSYLFIDTGLPAGEVDRLVRAGDPVSFAQPPLELSENILAGRSLDDRASVAALTSCLEELQSLPHSWDVWAVASVQEEETLAGAYTSTFSIRPDLAVAIDVTFGKGPGSPNDYRTFPLGKGPTIGWGANIHPGLYQAFKDLAEKLEIPYAVELMPKSSGTDAVAMQVNAEGIPTMVLGIPARYLHTPVEMVSMNDIQACGHLMAEFVARLDGDCLQNLSLDVQP